MFLADLSKNSFCQYAAVLLLHGTASAAPSSVCLLPMHHADDRHAVRSAVQLQRVTNGLFHRLMLTERHAG